MSEENLEAVEVQHEGHHHHDVEVERIETVSSTTTPWTVRLIFGILGVVFIATAVVAWFFRDTFDGHLAQALPWVIGGLAVLGVGAIVESITTEIWITLIVGLIALAVTFLIVGRSQIFPADGALYVVDRFSGTVQFCTPDGCLPLKQVAELPKPPAPLPPPPPPAADPAAAAPAAAPVPAVVPAPVPPPPAVVPAKAPAAPVKK